MIILIVKEGAKNAPSFLLMKARAFADNSLMIR